MILTTRREGFIVKKHQSVTGIQNWQHGQRRTTNASVCYSASELAHTNMGWSTTWRGSMKSYYGQTGMSLQALPPKKQKKRGDPPRSFQKLEFKSAVLCPVSTFSVPPSHASVLIRFLVPTPPFLAWIRHSGRRVSRCFGAEDLAPFAADSGVKFSFQFCPSLALECY